MNASASKRLIEVIASQGSTSFGGIGPELSPERIDAYRLLGYSLLLVGMAAGLWTLRLGEHHRSRTALFASLVGVFGGPMGIAVAAAFVGGPDVDPNEAVAAQRAQAFLARSTAIVAAGESSPQRTLAPDALDRPVVWLRAGDGAESSRWSPAWTYAAMTPHELTRSLHPCIVVAIRDEAVFRFAYMKVPSSQSPGEGGTVVGKAYQDVWHLSVFRWPEGDYLGSDSITATPPDVSLGRLIGNDISGPAREWLARRRPGARAPSESLQQGR